MDESGHCFFVLFFNCVHALFNSFKVIIYSGTWIFWLMAAKKLTFDMYYWIHLILLVSVWVSRHWLAVHKSWAVEGGGNRTQMASHRARCKGGRKYKLWITGHLREFRVITKRKISPRLTAGITLGLTRLPMLLLDRISKMSYISLLKALGTARGFAQQNERGAVTEFLRTHSLKGKRRPTGGLRTMPSRGDWASTSTAQGVGP